MGKTGAYIGIAGVALAGWAIYQYFQQREGIVEEKQAGQTARTDIRQDEMTARTDIRQEARTERAQIIGDTVSNVVDSVTSIFKSSSTTSGSSAKTSSSSSSLFHTSKVTSVDSSPAAASLAAKLSVTGGSPYSLASNDPIEKSLAQSALMKSQLVGVSSKPILFALSNAKKSTMT